MDAQAYKAKGNEAFSAKDFPVAIENFTSAIELDPASHVLYSNRSAAYASMNDYVKALGDAEKCVALNKSWAKGYVRLGAAYHGLRKYSDAINAYKSGLAIEPTNATLLESITTVESDMQAETRASQSADPFGRVFGKDCVAKIQANAKLAPYMLMPDFVQMLSQIVESPSTVQNFLKDKRIMHCFMELSGLNVGGTDFEEPQESKPAPKKEAPKKDAPKAQGTPEGLKLKEEGNALYKQRKFDEALEKYSGAFEVEPTNTTYLLNRTAVIFEQGKLDECFEECAKALEHASEHKADYAIVSKLLTRQAFCLQKQAKYDEAIVLYRKALLENRNADTLTKMQTCEKEKKEAEIKAYINPELAQQKKDEGNTFFKADKFPQAVECYSEAIKRNPTEHTAYSNRAAAYLKLGAFSDAMNDCEKCLKIKPDFVKAHARKAHACFWTKQYNKALQSYDDGLKIDPDNAECKEGKMRTMAKIQEMATGEGDEDAAQRAMSDPEIQSIMGDSYMQMVLGEMQKNPARINDYMKDPTIAAKINKLITAGIIRVGNK